MIIEDPGVRVDLAGISAQLPWLERRRSRRVEMKSCKVRIPEDVKAVEEY